MSEKEVSMNKLCKRMKGKFSRNDIRTVIFDLVKDGKISRSKWKPIPIEDARIIIEELLKREPTKKGYYIHCGLKYIKTPEDSLTKPKNGFIAEHRYVAEKKIGRKLSMNEPIFHVNGDKLDNRPENLMVCRSASELNKARNSIFEVVEELMETGCLEFDFDAKKYKIRL